MLNLLSEKIISTVAYYDIMDYPLTSFEIWKFLIRTNNENDQFSLGDVIKELEINDELKKYISEYRGFYFLSRRKKIVEERIEKNKISEKKIKIAKKIANGLKYMPFIKTIAVAGRVAMKNAQKKSDIDFFVIIKHGHIFIGRFFATALIHMLGKRRYGNKITDKICLNHFITDNHSVSIKDLYSSRAYTSLVPIYGKEGLNKFFKNNEWIAGYQANFSGVDQKIIEISDGNFSVLVKKFLEKIFSWKWFEKSAKNIQIKKIKKNPITYKQEGVIIYGDLELAFWPDFQNQGPAFYCKFSEKIKKFNFSHNL